MTPPEVPNTIKSGGPILPPMAPPAPSWKQEMTEQASAVEPTAVEPKVEPTVDAPVENAPEGETPAE